MGKAISAPNDKCEKKLKGLPSSFTKCSQAAAAATGPCDKSKAMMCKCIAKSDAFKDALSSDDCNTDGHKDKVEKFLGCQGGGGGGDNSEAPPSPPSLLGDLKPKCLQVRMPSNILSNIQSNIVFEHLDASSSYVHASSRFPQHPQLVTPSNRPSRPNHAALCRKHAL